MNHVDLDSSSLNGARAKVWLGAVEVRCIDCECSRSTLRSIEHFYEPIERAWHQQDT